MTCVLETDADEEEYYPFHLQLHIEYSKFLNEKKLVLKKNYK